MPILAQEMQDVNITVYESDIEEGNLLYQHPIHSPEIIDEDSEIFSFTTDGIEGKLDHFINEE